LTVSARELSAAAGKLAVGSRGGPGGGSAGPGKDGRFGFVRTAGGVAAGIAGAVAGGAIGAEAGHMVDEALGSDSGWGELVGGVLGSSVGAWALSQVGFLKAGFVGAIAKVTSSLTSGTEADVITEEPDALGPNGLPGDWVDANGKLHVRRRGDGDRLRSTKSIYDPSDRATVGAYETGGGFGGEDYRPVPVPLPVPRPDLGTGDVTPLAPAAVKLGEAADNLAAKAAEPVRVEGQTEVHIAPIKVDASGMATVPGQTVRAPLALGSQGAGVGSSLRGSERNY
jgi:hypothetical protein